MPEIANLRSGRGAEPTEVDTFFLNSPACHDKLISIPRLWSANRGPGFRI